MGQWNVLTKLSQVLCFLQHVYGLCYLTKHFRSQSWNLYCCLGCGDDACCHDWTSWEHYALPSCTQYGWSECSSIHSCHMLACQTWAYWLPFSRFCHYCNSCIPWCCVVCNSMLLAERTVLLRSAFCGLLGDMVVNRNHLPLRVSSLHFVFAGGLGIEISIALNAPYKTNNRSLILNGVE